MISPLSVLLALGMTSNGAKGDTLTSLLDVLSGKSGTLEQFNEANSNYLKTIKSLKGVEVSIGNSLWLNRDIEFDQAFLAKTGKVYQATAKNLDFSDKSSLTSINAWVSDATRGTIPSILDSLDPAAVMYLLNAVYFKGDWETPFTKESTHKQDFFVDGESIPVPFMHKSASFPYANAMDAQMLMMPYSDERFAFVAILPYETTSLSAWLASQKKQDRFTQRMFAAVAAMQETPMELSLPKFEASYKDSLANELKLLGMREPFDSSRADFSLMTEKRSKDLYIEEVLHKTFIRIDELGSEAAAVTSIMMRVTSMPMREELILTYDRPFFYAIIDREAKIPLFMGILTNPLTK